MNENMENSTPRERIDAELMRRILAESGMPVHRDADIPVSASPAWTEKADFPPEAVGCGCAEAVGNAEKKPVTDCAENEVIPEPEAENDVLSGRSLAMVYSPRQAFTDLYDTETGLTRGTIFARLDLPFEPASCGRRKE